MARQRTSPRFTRCPACKLGELSRTTDTIQWRVALGWSWPVTVTGMRCSHCKTLRLSKTQRRRADMEAYAQHRTMILERDRWTCQRCKGKSGDARLEVAHRRGKSRARNPNPKTKHQPENLEAVCVTCHRIEHSAI